MTKALSLPQSLMLAALIAFFAVVGASFAYADDDAHASSSDAQPGVQRPAPKPLPQNVRGEVRDNIEDRREAMEEKRGELRDRLEDAHDRFEDRRKHAIRKAGALMIAMMERMEKLIERIEERATKLAEQGADMTKAREHIAKAKTELAAAEADWELLKAKAEAALDATATSTFSQSVRDAKPLFESMKSHLRAAHKAIKDAVAAMKEAARAAGLGVDAAVRQNNATSTDED